MQWRLKLCRQLCIKNHRLRSQEERREHQKHDVEFEDAQAVLPDPFALTWDDEDAEGVQRFLQLGMDTVGRALEWYSLTVAESVADRDHHFDRYASNNGISHGRRSAGNRLPNADQYGGKRARAHARAPPTDYPGARCVSYPFRHEPRPACLLARHGLRAA